MTARSEAIERMRARFERALLWGWPPLYTAQMQAVATSDELAALACTIGRGQAEPNLLFAAVHYLLENGAEHELHQWYPDLVDDPREPDSVAPAFEAFCKEFEPQLGPLLATKNVQTNVVKRAVALRYGLAALHARGVERVSLVEIGASSGLLMLFDRYAYRLGGQRFGEEGSPVQISVDWRAETPVPDLDALPEITSRVGLDLQPIDLDAVEQRGWLRALIWPEDRHKRALFDAATELWRADRPEIRTGDMFQDLVGLVAEVDPPVVVFHSFVLSHVPADKRATWPDLMASLGRDREVHELTLYALADRASLTLDGDVIATTDPHCEWLAPT